MGRYFFHLHECGTVLPDHEGSVLPDLQSAIVKAIRDARSVICAEAGEGQICLSCHIEIEHEETGERTIVPFSDAVRVTAGKA